MQTVQIYDKVNNSKIVTKVKSTYVAKKIAQGGMVVGNFVVDKAHILGEKID